MKLLNYLLIGLSLTSLTHCNSGGYRSSSNYSVSAEVSGLEKDKVLNLELYVRNFDELYDDKNIYTDSTQHFYKTISPYNNAAVVIGRYPTGQACTINNPYIEAISQDTTLQVICSSTIRHLSGTVSGLGADKSLSLSVNRQSPTTITENGSFTIDDIFADGANYEITFASVPQGQYCTINNGSGTFSDDVSNVDITCSNAQQFFTAYGKGYKGDFGGRAVADARCASYLSEKNFDLTCSGGVVAFLSTSSNDEIRDFPTNYNLDTNLKIYTENLDHALDKMRSMDSYNKVADNWDDLLDGSLDTQTNVNTPWSGSNSDGSLGDNCNDWSSASDSVTGNTMQNYSKNNDWLSAPTHCSTEKFIGCLCITSEEAEPETFTISGTVSGLADGSVTLVLGDEILEVSEDGSFTFATEFSAGEMYDVSLSDDPITQTCTIENESGTIDNADVSNISITCETDPVDPEATYSVGGTLSGLAAEASIQVRLVSMGDPETDQSEFLVANGAFSFPVSLETGDTYEVTIATQPDGVTCTIENATGTVATEEINNISIICP